MSSGEAIYYRRHDDVFELSSSICPFRPTPPPFGCRTSLFDLTMSLACTGPSTMGHQLVQSKGLLVLATSLRRTASSRAHTDAAFLTSCCRVARDLVKRARDAMTTTTDQQTSSFWMQLLRQLHTYLLVNPDIWIAAPVEVSSGFSPPHFYSLQV